MRKLCLQFAGGLAASIVASAGVRAAPVPVDGRQVLPFGILPSHYDLQLAPDAEHPQSSHGRRERRHQAGLAGGTSAYTPGAPDASAPANKS
jgi:hypothetical protein